MGQTTSVGAEVRDRVAATCTVHGGVLPERTESTEGPEQTYPKKLYWGVPDGPGLGILGTHALPFRPGLRRCVLQGSCCCYCASFQVPSALQGLLALA